MRPKSYFFEDTVGLFLTLITGIGFCFVWLFKKIMSIIGGFIAAVAKGLHDTAVKWVVWFIGAVFVAYLGAHFK